MRPKAMRSAAVLVSMVLMLSQGRSYTAAAVETEKTEAAETNDQQREAEKKKEKKASSKEKNKEPDEKPEKKTEKEQNPEPQAPAETEAEEENPETQAPAETEAEKENPEAQAPAEAEEAAPVETEAAVDPEPQAPTETEATVVPEPQAPVETEAAAVPELQAPVEVDAEAMTPEPQASAEIEATAVTEPQASAEPAEMEVVVPELQAPVEADAEAMTPEPQAPVETEAVVPELQAPVETEAKVVPQPQAPAEAEATVAPEPQTPVETEAAMVPEPQAPMETEPAVASEPQTPAETEAAVVPEPKTPAETEVAIAPEPQAPVETEPAMASEPQTPAETEAVVPEPQSPTEAESAIPEPQTPVETEAETVILEPQAPAEAETVLPEPSVETAAEAKVLEPQTPVETDTIVALEPQTTAEPDPETEKEPIRIIFTDQEWTGTVSITADNEENVNEEKTDASVSSQKTGDAEQESESGQIQFSVELDQAVIDRDSISFTAVRSGDGETSLPVRVEYFGESGEMICTIADIPDDPSGDGIYIVTATATDRDGRQIIIQRELRINRYGSVYETGAQTREQLEQHYLQSPCEITLNEKNIDDVSAQNLILCKDGEHLSSCGTGDYSLKGQTREDGWKNYEYVISEHCFEEEGAYEVQLVSSDGAGNSSFSGRDGQDVNFVIDHTGPDLLIAGVEDGEEIRAEEAWICLDVRDRSPLREVRVYQDGNLYGKISGESLRQEDGIVKWKLTGSGDWQRIRFEATDAAGNTGTSEELRLLVFAG